MNGAAGVSCVVLVDKPVGPTSFDVVRTARRGLREKVGHAGTLDPFASGLLVVLVGRATRVSNLLMELPKTYEVVVQFGAVSSTGDPTGGIEPTGRRVSEEDISAALEGLRGAIRQRVPMTSAVKVAGEKLYRKAHRGETVETPEREVMVYEFELDSFDEEAQAAKMTAVTGSGTYVRSLAEDLGRATGAGAYAAALRRTRSGGMSVDEALAPEELSPERYQAGGRGVLSLDEALAFLPAHEVGAREARLAENGSALPDGPAGRFRVRGPQGLIAVYEGRGDVARPLVVFAQKGAGKSGAGGAGTGRPGAANGDN